MIGFDKYDRRARLTPGLLAVAAVPILVVSLGLKKYPTISVAGGVLGAAGGAYLLAVLVRHFGRRLEADLWSSWNGRPTTRWLRLRESSTNAVEREVWRFALERVTGIALLSAIDEVQDPTHADQIIETAVNQVLRLGQGAKQYPLLHAENIQYGFERNLWGVRKMARAISGACVAALVVVLLIGPGSISAGSVWAGIVIDLGLLIGWFIVPSVNRVQFAADRYARQLFQAVVSESQKMSAPTPMRETS
jgi:hypothetical protein